MAYQTEMSGSNGRTAAPRAVVENFGEFMHDVVTLGELQAKLFVADMRDFKSGAVAPMALMGVAFVLALGCAPVLLMGLAWLLVDLELLQRGWAFLVAALAGLLLTATLGATGWFWFRRHLAVLNRSQIELERNITWIKSVLKHSGRTTRDPYVVIRNSQ